nr:MAG TPA: adenine-specific methyltransferase [Caudoviricetes sp.]
MIDTHIGSAKDNMNSAVHNWYKFTAGFSYKFVDLIVDDMQTKPSCIYDPFAGCGTTLVAAQKKMINSIGIESQKLMCDIINAKLNWDIDSLKLTNYIERIISYVKDNIKIDISELFCNKLLIGLYDLTALKELYLIRNAIRSINDPKYALFLNLALSQTLHKAAIHPIAVPYISRSKYQQNSGNALEKFHHITQQMLADLESMPHRTRYAAVYNADSRKKNDTIANGSCDLCITSPPYLNNLDYGEVSKVHSHFFEITKDWHDITEKIRHNLVTSATTHYKDTDFNMQEFCKSEFAELNSAIIVELQDKFNSIRKNSMERGGKKSFHILMMHYFEDMFHVLKEMYRVLSYNSKAYLILGDSAPYGIYVPTTKILGEISQSVGFGDFAIYKIRERGNKWKCLKNRHNISLSENILVLDKK